MAIATEARMQGLVEQLGQGRLTFCCISGDPTGMLWEKKYQVNGAVTSLLGVAGLAATQRD